MPSSNHIRTDVLSGVNHQTTPGDAPGLAESYYLSSKPAVALRWHRGVISHLAGDRPPNQTTVLAVAAVLLAYSDPDGSHCYPSQATVAQLTGLHHDTVKRATAYLVAAGYLFHVRNRERGLREYQLTIPIQIAGGGPSDLEQTADDARSEDIQIADGPRSETPDRGSDRGSDRGWSATTSVPPEGFKNPQPPQARPRAAGTNPRAVGGNPRASERNPRAVGANPRATGLAFAIAEARGDPEVRDAEKVGRHRFNQDPEKYRELAEREERHRRLEACGRCEGTGLLHFTADGRETTRDDIDAEITEACDHRPVLAVVGASP